MSPIRRIAAVGIVLAGLTSTLAAQDRGWMVQAFGGGYSHINNLNAAGTAHWNTGFNIGAALGYQATEYVSVQADFTMAQNKAVGITSFADKKFNRYYYGAHLELRYPIGETISPYLFAGGGAVTVSERGGTEIANFTKPAGMFGAGFMVALPNSRASVLLEGKGLMYQWDRGGFKKTQLDVGYSVGLAYRFGR